MSSAELLRAARYEVLPLDGIVDEVCAHLPRGSRVTVTASPTKGLPPTLDVTERLAAAGFNAVPHVPARLVRDVPHLDEILGRLRAAGVRELFVPAGDAKSPAGDFAGSAALLQAMGERRGQFAQIGIAGYPEGHPLMPGDAAMRSLREKAPLATCIISQICFDSAAIEGWIRQVRGGGTGLPIWIGLPGIVDMRRLLRITAKIGMADSSRFALGHRGWVRRLVARQFRPDGLLRELGPRLEDAGASIAGYHLYTFNEVARTERWRREQVERLSA